MTYFIGLDIGQMQDYTAIALIDVAPGDINPIIEIRHLERLRLGTPYPTIVERVALLMQKLTSYELYTGPLQETRYGVKPIH